MSFTTVKLKVPVEMVKFPHKAAIGSSLQSVENHLEMTTDMSGMPYAIPAIKLAWVKTSVKTMAPIFLVHGTNADHTTWEVPKGDSFSDYFLAHPQNFYGISFSDIDLTPNGPINENGDMLESKIAERLASVGAKQCHIIGHSKGGIDSRAMIYKHFGKGWNTSLDLPGHFEVLSLYTLDTPHRGTVLSDISWYRLHADGLNVVADSRWADLITLMDVDFRFAHDPPSGKLDAQTQLPLGLGPGAPGGHALEAQMTEKMNKWNLANPIDFSRKNAGDRPIKFYNTASDADWNVRDMSIDATERNDSGIPPIVATSMYRMLYWAKQVQTRPSTRYVSGVTGTGVVIPVTELYVPDNQRGAQWNDLVVSLGSAVYDGGTLFTPEGAANFNGILYKNHSSVKTHSLLAAIVGQIRMDWGVQTP